VCYIFLDAYLKNEAKTHLLATLVKVLAGRTHQSCGSVILNGVEVALPRFKHLIGFVPQDDSVLSDFTVRESVLYSARVRLTGARTRASIEKHVLCILSCMGLLHIRNSRVCRLSGGERKRVSIAIQLVATPLALVLDEPTSGLDASSALSLLKILKTISTMGVTIVCVMHQPRADIFEILDNVLLLRSGRQVFLGNAAEAEAFFTSKGYTFSDSYNFADALLDIISSVNPMIDLDMEHVPTAIVVNDRTSGEALERISAEVMSRMAPWYRQLWLNFCRESSQQCRRYTVLMTIHFVAAASGLMIGLAVYTFDGHLFHGVFKDPFQLLSSAVDYTLVTQLALLSTLAISMSSQSYLIRRWFS
jgi:ABC-type multidrug transport system ATPase subunit